MWKGEKPLHERAPVGHPIGGIELDAYRIVHDNPLSRPDAKLAIVLS